MLLVTFKRVERGGKRYKIFGRELLLPNHVRLSRSLAVKCEDWMTACAWRAVTTERTAAEAINKHESIFMSCLQDLIPGAKGVAY